MLNWIINTYKKVKSFIKGIIVKNPEKIIIVKSFKSGDYTKVYLLNQELLLDIKSIKFDVEYPCYIYFHIIMTTYNHKLKSSEDIEYYITGQWFYKDIELTNRLLEIYTDILERYYPNKLKSISCLYLFKKKKPNDQI